MNVNSHLAVSHPLELWGGIECTVNRVFDDYFCQMTRNGHARRDGDLERFASLGIRAIRYPVLWERVAPEGLAKADWSWPDERLGGLQKLGLTPIVGLVHHGSGPRHTSLIDPGFADQLAKFAGAVARRYPWVMHYTPVNEPLTTARFSGLYGVWYPHGRDERTFLRALLNQCRAVVLSMREIRAVNPQAKLVQTDDLGKTYSTPEMAGLAAFYNDRRWLAWDLLCGKVGPEHALWRYLLDSGIEADEFLWFRDNPCPPDVIGINYYITSERWLDQRVDRYPKRCVGSYHGLLHADIEAARALAEPTLGIKPLLLEAWERYHLPLAITEAHIDAHREDQLRWLLEIWESAKHAQREGADVRAVTAWALLGSFDWNSLVTSCKGYYEPGPFDVRSPVPRPTAIAGLMRELSAHRQPSHPVLHGQGVWRRPERHLCPPVVIDTGIQGGWIQPSHLVDLPMQPILVIGATGTLGRAFGKTCERRHLCHKLLTRQDMDITDEASVERAIAQHRPWAIINAGGYVRVDEAENDADRCWRENTVGPAILAAACARHGIHLMTFSSDLVFDGQQHAPYVEGDPIAPLNVYGKTKAAAERQVLDAHSQSLVVRTSAFFGPWDRHNFVTQALQSLSSGQPFQAASDLTVSPTYVPDLVNSCLDLLVDRETGVWHLTNTQAITWVDLAHKAATLAGVDTSRLEARRCHEMKLIAPRPRFSALRSERAMLLPSLDDAIQRFLHWDDEVSRTQGWRSCVQEKDAVSA
ncbi:MAG: NAD-dependent epimerase/dehydratase family protein [Rubrivivax sp.]|nr:MAG: NAD-dependent epimerase/dehydratase family protein [Rubrivivax sp.]